MGYGYPSFCKNQKHKIKNIVKTIKINYLNFIKATKTPQQKCLQKNYFNLIKNKVVKNFKLSESDIIQQLYKLEQQSQIYFRFTQLILQGTEKNYSKKTTLNLNNLNLVKKLMNLDCDKKVLVKKKF
ncbi:hypothetical protein ABPG72_003380 [Tetrahymena utriculariae]